MSLAYHLNRFFAATLYFPVFGRGLIEGNSGGRETMMVETVRDLGS